MINFKEQKRIYNSVFYLLSILLRENWILVLGIFIFCLGIWIPLCYFYTKGDGSMLGYFLMSSIIIMPIVLITVILIPTIHEQISSTSIKMRMKTSGLSFRIYAISMILFFTILLIALFFLMLPIYYSLFNQVITTSYAGTDMEGNYLYEDVIQYQMAFSWLNALILAPISIMGLVSVGFLIGNIKINEIVKGIIILFILVLFFANLYVMDPLGKLKEFDPSESYTNLEGFANQRVKMAHIIMLNPFGSLSFTLNTSVNSGYYPVKTEYFVGVNDALSIIGCSTSKIVTQGQIAGSIYSGLFFGLAVATSRG